MSKGFLSKEKPIPWKQACKEKREASDSRSLGWITFRGSRPLRPEAFFAKRKLRDKHLREKLISVSR